MPQAQDHDESHEKGNRKKLNIDNGYNEPNRQRRVDFFLFKTKQIA